MCEREVMIYEGYHSKGGATIFQIQSSLFLIIIHLVLLWRVPALFPCFIVARVPRLGFFVLPHV